MYYDLQMSKSTNLNRRKFLQLSAAASAGTALGCNRTAFDFPQRASNLSAVNNGFTPRKLSKKPNILIAVLDDVGFADLGCYGSDLQTKCMDDLAAKGTRFNNFHVTALCAPTRACLLTGRNAHAVGVGNIAEWGRDHPGYKGWIRQDAATLAEILKPEWKVELDCKTDHTNGVILASGDSGAGYELYVKDGFLIFSYTYVRKDVTVVQSKQRIPAGLHTVEMKIVKTGKRTATINFTLNNQLIGSGDLPRMWEIYTPNSGLRCGENRHAPISRDYEPPYVLEGLKKVVIDVAL